MARTEEESPPPADVDEEFRVWKKNTPLLYDLVISHILEWPSLTVQWLPSSPSPAASSSTSTSVAAVRSLILGTHTTDEVPNFLMTADVRFPVVPPPDDPDAEVLPSVDLAQKIPHTGEVNRARHMPQSPLTVATKTCGEEVLVFRLGEGDAAGGGPEMVLKGHSAEGYGVSWSPMKEGFLLSGSSDSKICLWDIGASGISVLDARDLFEAHEASVMDVAWHLKNENLFASVGDDHKLMIWDSRSKKPQHVVVAHEDEVNSLCFSPFNEWIIATASADTSVNLFDWRNLARTLHTFCSHTESILQVEWSPKHETILASASEDNRLMLWDISRIGDEQAEGDGDDGPPELLFVHGGHTSKISEFCWSPDEPWVIASVDEDHILQVWQPAESIYRE